MTADQGLHPAFASLKTVPAIDFPSKVMEPRNSVSSLLSRKIHLCYYYAVTIDIMTVKKQKKKGKNCKSCSKNQRAQINKLSLYNAHIN